MKLNRLFSFLLALMMLCLPLAACSGQTPDSPAVTTGSGTDAPVIDTPAVAPPTVYRTSYDKIPEASDELIDQLWNATQTKIDGIMNAANELTPAEGGTVYYVSSLNGDDKADGLSPETAWKTLDRVTVKQRKTIASGDVVAFERGSIFYNYTDDGYSAFKAKSGVTYTAYGEGEKPILTAALGDAADPSYWKQLDENPNVWYTTKYVDHLSVGNITFNDGEYMGEGVFLEYIDEKRGGKTINGMTGLPYSGPQDLHYERQFQYIYESGSSGTVYLYSSEGNPGELYDSIHFGRNLRTINAEETEGVVLDNLSIRYASVGVMMDDSKNFTMKNCEIAYVGGSLLEGAYYNGSQYCRWDPHVGNGTVVDGSCDGIYIYDNYVHHVYEEAFSTYHNEGQPMLNLHYTGNVIMYCRQAVSLRGATEVSDVEWSDNHVWYTGYEYPSLNKPWFGEDGGAIEFQLDGVGGNLNFHMKNNVVAFASAMLSDFDAGNESYQFENNIYVGEDTCYMRIDGKPYHWDDSAYEAMKTIAHDETAEMYVVRTESDYQSERTLASMSIPADVKAGDVVTFGAYEQDNDASNGAEAIEWIVLEVKDGKALLLSKYVLDVHYFYPSDASLYWGLSSIREFFESDFIERAFTDEETAKMNVVSIHMVASNKYGEETADTGDISRIFLLTAQELIGYLGKDGLAASATEYALNRTGFGNNIPVKDGNAAYWTMNFGKAYNKFVGYITVKGEWDQYGSYWWRSCNMGLRPAMWITVG